ncbi:MAG: hypothetical protein RLZZ505_994 [Verrucomicrobiota bacterium]|jgi:hypothetical protein
MQHTHTNHLAEDHTMNSAGDSDEIMNFTRTLERVTERTIELAILDGRPAHQIRQGDYERAKREIAASSYL